jgi:hypothetical protein
MARLKAAMKEAALFKSQLIELQENPLAKNLYGMISYL